MGENNELGGIHWALMGFQILILLIAKIYRWKAPEQYEQFLQNYILFDKSAKEASLFSKVSQLDDEMKYALAKAYEHPWYKLESSVKFVAEKKQLKKEMTMNRKAPTLKQAGKLKDSSKTNEFLHVSHDDVFSDKGGVTSNNNEVIDHTDIDRVIKLRQSGVVTPRE